MEKPKPVVGAAWATRLPKPLFAALLFLGLTLILNFSIPSGPAPLRVGDVAKQNVRAAQRVSYVSQIKTRQAKEAAAALVSDVFDYDPGVAQQQRAQAQVLFNGIANIRVDTSTTLEQKNDRIQRLADGIVTAPTSRLILTIDDASWPAIVAECGRVLDEVMRDRVRQGDLVSVRAKLPSRFSQTLTPVQLSAAVAIVSDLIKPNEILNTAETQKQRRDAQDKIEPVRETVEKGEIVVREGNVVSALDLEKLAALGLQQARREWPDIIGSGLLVFLLVGLLTVYITYFHPALFTGDYRVLILAVGILIFALAGRIAGSETLIANVSWVYIVPFAAVPMLVGILFDQQLAVVVALVMGIVAGFASGQALDVGALVIIGGAVGALRARHIQRLGAFFWAGVVVSATNLAVVLAFFLPSPDLDPNALLAAGLMAATAGGLAAAITAVTFAPLGNVLGATTVLHLLELAHPSQPLFRRLLLEAPGTYHHCVVISSLAERAAEAIGGNPLLARVGAYYHDIGKVVRPYLFIENQVNGVNIHDTLDPHTSAKSIMAHVQDGLDLARKHGLPQRVQDMIPQHHGTKLVSYFYARARAISDDIKEEDFRYPGPKPQTKEAGILMLADGVEASVRASRDHSQVTMERIVSDIIAAHVTDGQLNECDLTLRDLDVIGKAFCGVLQGVYHPRIAYPSIGSLPAPTGAETPMALPGAGDTLPPPPTRTARSRKRKRAAASVEQAG
jgi:hypothetical protein